MFLRIAQSWKDRLRRQQAAGEVEKPEHNPEHAAEGTLTPAALHTGRTATAAAPAPPRVILLFPGLQVQASDRPRSGLSCTERKYLTPASAVRNRTCLSPGFMVRDSSKHRKGVQRLRSKIF